MHFQKILATLILLGGLATSAQAQQIVRYQLGSKRYTASQLDSVVAARNQAMRDKGVDMQFGWQKAGSQLRGDTLVYATKLRGANKAIWEAEALYQKFVGQPLPPFELRTLTGQKMRSADLRGRPLVINMWFTTCPPCVAEMPALNQFQAENPGTNYVSMTYESAAKVTEFLKKQPFSFTHIPNARAYCEQFTTSYPITIFVDRKGIVRSIGGGLPMRYDKVNQRLGTEADITDFQVAWQAIQ